MEEFDIQREKQITEDEHLGDSFVGFHRRCHKCREWTDRPDAEYCWNCGEKYHK